MDFALKQHTTKIFCWPDIFKDKVSREMKTVLVNEKIQFD